MASGNDKLKENIEKVKLEIDAKIAQAVLEACLLVEGSAKYNTPVDTGYLRRSFTHKVDSTPGKTEGEVGTNVECAHYVEFGTGIHAENKQGKKEPWWYKTPDGQWIRTSGQRPKHMLTNAFNKHKKTIQNMIQKAVKKVTDKP